MDSENAPIFKASEIREKGGLREKRAIDPAFFAGIFDAPVKLVSAELDLVFSVGSDAILLEGKATGTFELECARCGEIFSAKLTEPFDEVYEDTVEFIDVRELARDTAAVMVPMKPLCNALCKGRCPVCSGDLNTTACGCKIETESPFKALKDLKRKNDNK